MKQLTTWVACVAIVFLPACQALSPQQRAAGAEAIQQSYDRGELTATQRDDALTALDGGGFDWDGLIQIGASIAGSILLGVPVAVGTTNKLRDKKYHTAAKPAA